MQPGLIASLRQQHGGDDMDGRVTLSATRPNVGGMDSRFPVGPRILARSPLVNHGGRGVATDSDPPGAGEQKQAVPEHGFEPCLDNNRAICTRERRDDASGKPNNSQPGRHRAGKNNRHADNGPHGKRDKSGNPKVQGGELGILEPRRKTHPRDHSKTEKISSLGAGENDYGSESSGWEVRREPNTQNAAVDTKAKSWKDRVKRKFIQKFYAPSTAAAKRSKRKKVAEILECEEPMTSPLTGEAITVLGAILDESGIKAAEQYVHEAKLMHVEAGHAWTDLLEAKLRQCKRALKRGKGPEDRAIEARPQDIGAGSWKRRLA